MVTKADLVNLDAMITREDFASTDIQNESLDFDTVTTISLREFLPGMGMGHILRKPDFQRETNHWGPGQIASLLACFVNGDLIPSVILWKSPTSIFVIDGGHRLSVLRAWVEDDYGDGPLSQKFFGYEISDTQKRTALKTRALVAANVGTWQHFQTKLANNTVDAGERKILTTVISRGLPIQWVKGDADKAENSFFQINTKGTPLDDVEELLLRSRRKPVSIAARAIIRAGKGHRYWSAFESQTAAQIEVLAKKLHEALFNPEIQTPIKTLDLPLGGPKGLRTALTVLIELMLIANQGQDGLPNEAKDMPDDIDGSATIQVLTKTLNLMLRLTGNDKGSLGLHPAVYFYGPTGRHSSGMFMGTIKLVARKLSNNDKEFFRTFTQARSKLETLLIEYKDLVATILQKQISSRRVEKYASLLDQTIKVLEAGEKVTEADLVKMAGLDGKIVIGTSMETPKKFSDDAKSQVFIQIALASSLKCPICQGYLDSNKSMSYDHIQRVQDGGPATSKNLQLTHPYCNQSVKN